MSKIVVVDKNDNVTGAVEKSIALKKGLIRRIVRIFVFNNKGELFLQRRSKDKDTYPDTWDQSAGGHVNEGEDYDQAARRELKEELGIKKVSLNKITKFYTEQKFGDLILREYSTLYTTVFNGDMKLSKKEIKGGKWFTLKKIDGMVENNIDDFPPGFVEAFKRYKKNYFSSN